MTFGALVIAAVVTSGAPQAAPAPTFADVAPIIQSRCVSCHRPGGDAPFSLASIEDVRRRAATIVAVTRSRYMPPWKPVPGYGEFRDARRMSDHEIALIERWVNSGMAAGSPVDVVSGFSRIVPEPDLILELPQYALPAGGRDVFRNFVVAVPPGVTRFVRGMHFRPGNRVVHHANIRVDVTPASRRLDDADPLPGYEGVIARSADFPDGHFLGWTPGQLAPVLTDETSWQLREGSDLVVQLHLRPSGKPEAIAPAIALYFGDRAPAAAPTMLRLGRQGLDVPAGAASHIVTDSFVLPVAVEARAIQPHAHYRARSMQAWADLPDGSRRELIRIDDWDMNWQDRYVFVAPLRLPAGTRVSMSYVFDNSIDNPRNPDRPPVGARWGWRSTDEMADVWIQVTAASDADRERLRRDMSAKMLAEDAIGAEVLLAREPDHVNLRNDAAQIYLALGQPAKALAHFAHVRAQQSASAIAWFNEGTALEAMGRIADAMARYQEAVSRDPGYSPTHNNIGVLLLRGGRVEEARAAFGRAVRLDSANADAHANYGLTMIAGGEPDQGLTLVERAITLKPALLEGLTSHVWLLAAHDDAKVRRPAAALSLAQRIATVSRDRAAALDALAASQAASGDFAAAVQTASAALSAAPATPPELRNAIRDRIALYRNRQLFILKQ